MHTLHYALHWDAIAWGAFSLNRHKKNKANPLSHYSFIIINLTYMDEGYFTDNGLLQLSNNERDDV